MAPRLTFKISAFGVILFRIDLRLTVCFKNIALIFSWWLSRILRIRDYGWKLIIVDEKRDFCILDECPENKNNRLRKPKLRTEQILSAARQSVLCECFDWDNSVGRQGTHTFLQTRKHTDKQTHPHTNTAGVDERTDERMCILVRLIFRQRWRTQNIHNFSGVFQIFPSIHTRYFHEKINKQNTPTPFPSYISCCRFH